MCVYSVYNVYDENESAFGLGYTSRYFVFAVRKIEKRREKRKVLLQWHYSSLFLMKKLQMILKQKHQRNSLFHCLVPMSISISMEPRISACFFFVYFFPHFDLKTFFAIMCFNKMNQLHVINSINLTIHQENNIWTAHFSRLPLLFSSSYPSHCSLLRPYRISFGRAVWLSQQYTHINFVWDFDMRSI